MDLLSLLHKTQEEVNKINKCTPLFSALSRKKLHLSNLVPLKFEVEIVAHSLLMSLVEKIESTKSLKQSFYH